MHIMAIPGQRFHINLDAELNDLANGRTVFNLGLVGDIKERTVSSMSKPPSPPRLHDSGTGLPAHRTRRGQPRSRQGEAGQPTNTPAPRKPSQVRRELPSQVVSENDKGRAITDSELSIRKEGSLRDPSIDIENKQRLAQMSDTEIEEARQELMAGLSPSLIEKLLKKANIDQGSADDDIELEQNMKSSTTQKEKSQKRVTFEDPAPLPSDGVKRQDDDPSWNPDGPPLEIPPDLHPASLHQSSLPQAPGIHFPHPSQAPDLDPSDPDFLSTLHQIYFPKLPADPSTTAWMAPLGPEAAEESAYSPSQDSQTVSALRFDFRGHLLPPRLSAQIPSTKGLHHHSHAPASAGYTVPELSHLARSTYPAQRCMAFQTLGRILYRLGRGDFGQEGEDLCEGLWQLMEQGQVVDQLVEVAAKEDSGNRSVWVVATEAVWLWRRGGGRKWKGR